MVSTVVLTITSATDLPSTFNHNYKQNTNALFLLQPKVQGFCPSENMSGASSHASATCHAENITHCQCN